MLKKFDGDGGVIFIDKEGYVGHAFSSEQLAWAYQRGNELHYGVNPGEDFLEIVN